jgi:hypothetical protein
MILKISKSSKNDLKSDFVKLSIKSFNTLLIMHPSTAHRASSQPLGFVPCVDHLSSDEANNKSYQYMRKTEKKQEYIFYHILFAMYTH